MHTSILLLTLSSTLSLAIPLAAPEPIAPGYIDVGKLADGILKAEGKGPLPGTAEYGREMLAKNPTGSQRREAIAPGYIDVGKLAGGILKAEGKGPLPGTAEYAQEMLAKNPTGSQRREAIAQDGSIGAAQNTMMNQYQQQSVQDMQKEAEFSKMQGQASVGNTIAKANSASKRSPLAEAIAEAIAPGYIDIGKLADGILKAEGKGPLPGTAEYAQQMLAKNPTGSQ